MEFQPKSASCGDFYITLISNDSLRYYPHNSSSSFTNVLYRSILIDSSVYEVGVSELFMDINSNTANIDDKADEHALTVTNDPSTFFGISDDDNIITIVKTFTTPIKYIKRDSKITNFFDDFKTFLDSRQNSEVKVSLSKTYTFGFAWPYTILTVEDPLEQYALQIQESLAETLGFKQYVFPPGIYTSEFVQSEEAFTKIPVGDPLTLRFIRQEVVRSEIKEPEEHEVDALIENIVMTLKKEKLNVRMPFDDQKNILHVYIEGDGIRFTLPTHINTYLGLSPMYTFYKSHDEIDLNHLLSSPTLFIAPMPSIPQVRHEPSPIRNVLIFSSITEPMLFGSSAYSILRLVSYPELINKGGHILFNPVNYQRVKDQDLTEIDITLKSDSFTVLRKSLLPTVVILHFRIAQNASTTM
jgi:hypothetical protein